MSKPGQRFEITPLVLDFGTRIVALRHVVRAEAGQNRPYRHAGAALIVAAAAGIGVEVARAGGVPLLGSGGSTGIWLALMLAGLGIFALVFQRRSLLISLDDGSRLGFTAGSQEFLTEIVRRIGEALAAPSGSAPLFIVDIAAQTITAADGRLVAVAATPPEPKAERIDPEPSVASMPPLETIAHAATRPIELPPERAFEASLADELEKAAAASQAPLQRGAVTVPLGRTSRPAARPLAAVAGSANAAAAALAAVPEPDATQDLDALVALVTRSPIQHKAALLDLLRVVDDFLDGGPTEAEDAIAHWQSFSSYVHQYLTDVDGLPALTARTGHRIEAAVARPAK